MIKKETLKAIETAFGLTEGEFDKLYADKDEKDIPIADFVIEKKADQVIRIANLEKAKENAGIEIGKEIMVKEIRTEFGIDKDKLPKKVDAKKVKEVVFAKVSEDLKIAPDTRVTELQKDKEELGKKVIEWETKYTGLEQTHAKKERISGVKTQLFAKAPEKLIIPIEDAFTLGTTKKGIKIDFDGETPVFKLNGAVMKNEKTLNPMTAEEVAPMIFADYVGQIQGGAGDKDKPGQSKPGTLAAFRKKMEDEGIPSGSEEYMKRLRTEFPGGKIPA